MQNLVERMVILAEGEHLHLSDLPDDLLSTPSFSDKVRTPTANATKPTFLGDTPMHLKDIERTEIESALKRNGWVQVRAARELGLTQRQLGYRIKKYGLSRFDSFQ